MIVELRYLYNRMRLCCLKMILWMGISVNKMNETFPDSEAEQVITAPLPIKPPMHLK